VGVTLLEMDSGDDVQGVEGFGELAAVPLEGRFDVQEADC